jgi:rhodanese-related sulfurtransferase
MDTTALAPQQAHARLHELTVIDVRTPGEYGSGHMPGAHNVPLDHLDGALPALRAAADRTDLLVVDDITPLEEVERLRNDFLGMVAHALRSPLGIIKTAVDWATEVQQLVERQYPQADRIRLVCDNFGTHGIGSLYEAFPPEQARGLASRLEIHYTPKHGSWLNIAEIEFSALNGQCLNRRIPKLASVQQHILAWEDERNQRGSKINWQFTTVDARIKLRHL